MDWTGIIAIVVPILGAIGGVTFWMGRWTKGVEDRLDNIEDSLAVLALTNRDEILDFYKEQVGGASNPSEKERLIEKLDKDTITEEEALKLREILEEEREKARREGLIKGAIATGGMILLLKLIEEILSE